MYKNITKILIALSALVFTTETASAQDPAFSQFYANPLYLNPAFAGTNICPRVNLNYRDQWPGIGRTYVTTSVSWDKHIQAIGGGLGIVGLGMAAEQIARDRLQPDNPFRPTTLERLRELLGRD